MRAMIIKEFRELRRDRRTLAMLIVLPLLLLTIFGYAASFTITSLDVHVVGPAADQVAAQIRAEPVARLLDVTTVDPAATEADARATLRDGKADVVVVTGGTKPLYLIDGSQLFSAQAATVVVARAGAAVDHEVLFNPDLTTSWMMVPALVGLILTFIGTIVTSIGLVKERAAGTLAQLAVMPLRPIDVIVGKIAPYFLLAAAEMAGVTLLGTNLFGVPFRGNVAVFALGGAIFLFVVLGLGVLISTVSQNVGQAIQGALFVLLPQIILSGMIFPLNAMHAGVRWIGYMLPLTYFIQISRGIMLRGAGLGSLLAPFGILTLMAVLIFGAAVARFRRSIVGAS
jgi:ABC-2 type transport system permease protein